MVPSRVVMLDLEADNSCEAKSKSCSERAVKLRLEWEYNFGMSWNFRVLDDFGLDRTWTCGTQFLWFLSAVTSFAWVFIFCCMTCLWVSCARKPRWSVLQFCEELCMQTVGFGLSLRFATSLHYFFVLVWDIGVWSITYYLSRCAARILG